MEIRKFFILCLVLSWFTQGFGGEAPPYYLSICAAVTNWPDYERNWEDTEEWIEYHRMMGVDHFFLYPHLCTPDFLEKLEKYESEGVITLIYEIFDWPRHIMVQLQRTAYKHFLTLYGDQTQWCAFIDDDEFILPQHHDSIRSYLQQYDETKVSKVQILWQCFGTSGWYHLPKDHLLTEHLYRCKDEQYIEKNPHKEIVKVSQLRLADVHTSLMKRGTTQYCKKEDIQINHYAVRDEFFATEVKRHRPREASRRKTTPEALRLFNTAEDWSIQKWVPALKERLQERRK